MVVLGIGAPIVQVYHEKSFILPDVSRVLACLYEKDVKFETHTASYKSLLRLQASSHAPVPFYDGPTFLEESREICRYIAEKYEHQGYPFLLGKDALERASVEQWLHNEEHAFNPPSRALFCHLAFPLGEEEDDDIDIHTRKLEEVLEVYEQRLSDSEFLVGNKFTLADLVHLPNSHYIKASNKFLYLYDSRKNVRRWWDAISDRDSWKKVLRYMKRVEEQNKQELKKQQQQQQEEEEDPRTSADSIRLDPRKQIRTEPRTILVPPIDTMSSSSIVPRTTKPLPSDTSPDELLISSSHSTPAADKTSAVQSKETTIFTNPQETPPTSVQSTPVTSKKHSIPVQSTKHATSPTTAKKPPITDAAKSRTKDASILESSSSKDVSSDLDVFDHYPSHTDVDTPYIEPTTRKTSETLDAFPGSNIGTGYTKTSSISAREEPDQPTASDFYKSDSTGTSVDSRFKESVPYSGRTPPELEPTDTSASKLHTTDVHRRLQVEQWHSAKTELNDLKHDDADHLVSTQQGKPRKDVQQYPSQDSEQATSHSVPQEPMSRDVLSQLEDHASSDQRGALMPPSTQEHGVTPSREAAAKDAHRRISSQAAYPGGQDTSKQPRDHGFVPRQGEPQDAREIFDESQSPDSTISSERFSYTSQSSLPRQDLDGARHATAPFETRYPGAEDTSKQAKDKISTPWQMTDHDAGDVKEETKDSESSSFQVEPSYFERADTPSWKQETIDDTFKETRYHSVAPPSQTRYQTPPSKARYPTAEDASKQPRGTAPTPKKQVAQDDNDTSEESKTADEVASTEQPLDAWRSPVSPRRQKVEDSSRSDTSFQKRYPYDEEDIQVANTASVSWQIAPDGDKNIFEETKVPDSTPTSAKPVYTPRAPYPPPRQAEVKDAKDKGRQSRVTIPESQKMVSEDAQTTHGERKTGTPGEQSSDRLQAIPQSRPPAAKGLSTKEEITNEQTVVPPLLSNEPSSRVQPASESLQEVASRGGLSTKPSTIEQWQRATVPLNDISSSSGDGEIGAETPGVQSASPSFPGASTARHATSDDKFGRQSIIDERVGEPTKILPTPYSAPAHTKRETPDGHEIVDSELVSTPDRHISEVAKIRQDQATVHEDVHDDNLSAHDVAKDTFKEAKVAESTPSSAKPMYSQQPAPTPRHAEMEDTWDKGMKGREAVPDRQQMLEKWAGTAGEQVSDRWKASAPSRQAAAEDVRGATGDTIQSPDVLDPSKKSRGAFEEAKGPGSVKEEKTSSIYQKKPLVAQDSQEQAQTIPAGEKADGSIRKHQQASDAPTTFVEKLDASEPARVKTHGDFSAEQPSRKDTTDDQKVAPPLSTRELTSQVQPPSEPSYDAALHRDLSSKPSTIYQWQLSSVPLHDVTSSSGDEVAKSTVDEKPTPMSQQKSDEQRAEPPVPIEAEIPDVQQASPSFPGASMDDRATIDDEFAMQSIIDQRVGEPTQMQTSSPDAHPASEPTKRGTPEGHEIGHLELVSTPGGQISEAKKARDDPARADIHDGHSAEEQYKKYTVDDQKVALSLSSKEPTSQVQPASEPLQRAVPDGDLPSKPFTIDQWQRTAAPLHGVITDSGDDEAAKSSNNDQKARPMSQEATPSSQSVNQMAKQSGEQSVEPPVPIVAEASDVARAAPPLPEAARADGATISDKFTEQSHIDERVGKPKQMQAPITAARPDSAPTLRRTPDSHEAGEFVSAPEGQRLEGAKATRDPATIHEDVYDASLSTHDAAIDEKTATDHASGDEVVTGSLHDHQTPRPASIQVQPTVETPHDSDSFQYVHTGDSGKAELAKPTVTDQEATVPAAGPTSADPQRADIIPAGVAHSEQKSTPSDKGSARAAQHPSPVEPIKADSNVSAANYTNAPQMIFRQQARPPAPSTIAIRTPDTQGVIGKIQEVTPDNRGTDDSGKPFVPNQEHVSHASEAIPGQEEMTSPQGARVFPTSDTQLSSADVHEVTPDGQLTVESITPLVSSGKQGSHVRSPFKPGEVGPAEKKFVPSDEESPHSSEESISGEPRKEKTVIPSAEQTTAQPTIIGRQDIPDRKQALTSEDTLNKTATHDDVHRTGTIEPARRPLSVEGEELTPATQAPSPSVARDSFYTELENVQSVKPSATPDAHDITPSSAPGEAALAEQKSASSGQGSADPAQPAFSLGPRNEEIRDLSPSAMLISSTDPSKGDPMVAVRDQAKDSQTTPGQQDILSTEHPSGKVQENIPGDNLGKAKPSRPSSAIQEGKPSKASASGIQLGSVPNELSVDEQKFAPPEPRSKEIGDLAPSTQLDSTTDPRNKDVIVAAPDQTTDSQTTPGRQVKFSAPTSQGPLGKLQEDEPADDSGEKKSSKPPSVVREGKPAAAVPVSAPDTQHGAAPDQVAVEQKFSPSGQDSVHSVQTSFSTEPTKEDTVVAPTDQTSTLERTVDQNYMTTAADKAKTPFSGTPDASSKTQKSIEDDHIDEKLPSQGQVSPDRHVSESPQGRSPEAHSDVVDKETTLGSSEAETSRTGPGSTSISADGRLSSSDMRAAGSLPETQDLQDSASAQNVLTDSLGKIESPGHVSTDQAMAPTMSPSLPSVAPLGTVPGTNSVQPPRQASTTSTVDLESVPDTQNGIPQGKATPGEQKSGISDQEPAHTTEHPSSTEPRKEEANTAAGDQPNVTQGPETTVRHQAKAPPPDSREALQKYQQPSHAVLPSDIRDEHTPGVRSAIVDKETTQTSVNEPNSTPTRGDVLPTRSVQNQEAQPPPATQAPTSQGLQDSAFSQNDSSGNIKSPRQASTDQIVAPAINSAAPTGAPQGNEPGPDSSQYVQSPFSTEPTKEDTVVTAADQAEDMQTITHQQAITPAPDTAKPPFPGARDASRKFQESTPDDGPVEDYSPKPAAHTQPPAATLDVSPPYASSKTKSTEQGAKPPTGYQASSPETHLGSSQTQGEAAPAEQKFAVSDEKSVNASKSVASAEPREEDTDAATADQTSVPPTNVTRQVTSSTPDASDALSRDQESSPDDGQIRNLGSPLTASQEEASRAGHASEGSTPKVHSAIVDEKRTLPSSQAQTSSTGPDSAQIGGDARLSGAGTPATSSMEKQEAEPAAATQAPTSKGLQDSGNIESPRQASTDPTVTPAMNSAAPSDAPEGPDSSRSVQTPFSTEPTKEDTIVTAADQAEDMQTITHQQAITPAPDTAKPPFPGARDASRKFQESTPDDGPVEDYSPKPAAHTQPPAATLDVSPPYASSKAKSTGQGAKPPTGYQASSPETHLGSSQTQGEAAPAEQKFAVSDEKSVNASKSVASAEPREEDTDAATADQTSVPPTNVTRQVTSSTPDASDALSRDQESSTDDGQIRNLGSPLIASQEEASRAGRASEGSTPKVHSAIVDEKRTLPSSQAQTSSTGPDSAQIGGDARLSGSGTPATSSMEKQEAEPAAATQAPTSKGLQDSGNIESPTDPTVTPAMNSAAPSDAPEGTEPGPDSSRSVQTPFSTEPTKEDTIVTAADQAEDMQTITHQQAITPAPDTDKPPFSGAQDASRKFQESTPDDGHIDEAPRGSSSEPREGQTFGPYRTNVDEKTTTFASSQANISDSGSDLARTLGDVVPSIVEGPAENYSPKPGAQTQLPAAVQDVSFDASSKAKSTGQAAKAPTGYLASSPDTQLGSSQTQGEAAPAEEKLPVSGMHSVQLSKGASFDVLSNEKTTMTQDQVNTLPNGDLSSNQVVEQSESLDSKGVNSGRNLEGASTNEESKVQLQSEDNTQGHGTDAPSLETDHPSNGGLPANSYQNNSSQSQAEASNKSIEQSSPGIRNKDGDSSRLDDSTDPTKPET
ncbi:uncharacterized protein [Miscanthus floridulus]|uniref:uncharacterized protein isoform X4 n=1 Tax=Miscanthus floridulus TaxID=154761 RepID=UPI0034591EF3